jgi:polyferredoxin
VNIEPVHFLTTRAPSTPLARAGDLLQKNRCAILSIQWAVVVFYLVLVAVPAWLPLPAPDQHMLDHLTLLAQFLFWGIWWPFVILSMLVAGRAWCGLFCPEGALTEFASRYGLGRPVPRWLKWGGWPFVAFIMTTVYGQLVSVYEYPKAVLLVLGGSTVAAIAVGLVYGRNKRVWCRHLCPVSGVFSLLSRLAPVHFSVDKTAWQSSIQIHPVPVNCAPLVDIRRMKGASDCHMCGRCSGYRSAVTLVGRLPGQEIVRMSAKDARPWDARLLVFGLLGVAVGAFQWSASPWFVSAKTAIAEWLIERDSFLLLGDNAPWWLLTHYPEANDAFTWLDGLGILAYIGLTALLVGGWISAMLYLAGRVLPGKPRANARLLTYSLTPMGGLGVFLGLSALTVSMLAGEGVNLPGLPWVRGGLLALGVLWSLWLGHALIWKNATEARPGARWLALGFLVLANAGAVVPWMFLFYLW